MQAADTAARPLFTGPEWTFELLEVARDAIEEIALGDLGLDVYPNQIEIISAEQMLDAYSCVGLPLMYQHWSFGKHFARDEALYRTGRQGLAYEIVINSNPCISYNMEENTMAMQTLVMAHAAFGHNHFFKNNYLFQQWTDAAGIHDYLAFAKNYIAACEERYGLTAVEEVLDAAHALQSQGVFRYGRPPKPTIAEREAMQRVREGHQTGMSILELWTDATLGRNREEDADFDPEASSRRKQMNLPQENLLYFLEKHSPVLEPWQCEILRIVRYWIDLGVRIFRVDNPHTKPLAFWEWLLHEINAEHPDVVFFAEAFTRPAMMQSLAAVGFQQSYTYFTWRNTKRELEEYLTEVSQETSAYFRPNFFVNTPDILTEYLQFGGVPAYKIRAALAATASPSWGVYAGYELIENVARPGSEENIDNEKYEYKQREWSSPETQKKSIAPYLTQLNTIRAQHPALRQLRNLRIHSTRDEAILCYSKVLPGRFVRSGRTDGIIVVANVDPHSARETTVSLDL